MSEDVVTMTLIGSVFMICYMITIELIDRMIKKKVTRKYIAQKGQKSAASSLSFTNKSRKKNIAQKLKKVDKLNENRKGVTFTDKVGYLYPNLVITSFFAIVFCAAGIVTLLTFVLTFHPILTAAAAFVSGIIIPFYYINKMYSSRLSKFLDEFVLAVEIIVRGVRTGLVLNDCMQIIVHETHPVVAKEFEYIIYNLKMGIPYEDTMKLFAQRIPLTEVNFFTTAMIIQNKTGGNLGEILQNLANLLRERKRLLGKIQALSSEAKASATIIGGLPFCVAFLLYLVAPEYLEPLGTTSAGNMVLTFAGVWMSIGIASIRKMINFYQ